MAQQKPLSSKSLNLQAISPHLGRRIADVERDLILATLLRCGGNRTWAADILGLGLLELRDRLLAYASDEAAPEGKSAKHVDPYRSMLEDYDPGPHRLPS